MMTATESIAGYEVKARQSRVVPATIPNPFTGAPIVFGQQWAAVYKVPPDKMRLVPVKGDLQPGVEREANPETMQGDDLERAKERDLLLPRVKDVKDQGEQDGCKLVVLHLIHALKYEGEEVSKNGDS